MAVPPLKIAMCHDANFVVYGDNGGLGTAVVVITTSCGTSDDKVGSMIVFLVFSGGNVIENIDDCRRENLRNR